MNRACVSVSLSVTLSMKQESDNIYVSFPFDKNVMS